MIRGQIPQHFYALYAIGLLESPDRERIAAHVRRHCPECCAGIRRGLGFWYMFALLSEDSGFGRAAERPDCGERAAG